jgi:hypothetical protein
MEEKKSEIMETKKGISETIKAIRSLKDDIIGLMNINWKEVVDELKDADPIEVKDLVLEALSAIMSIIAQLKTSIGPLTTILRLLKLVRVV